jgi:hypothetical protein
LLPSISRAKADQGESGRAPAAGSGEAVAVAPAAAGFGVPVLSDFDEQPVIRAAEAASPPVRKALRCGRPTLGIDPFLPVVRQMSG